MEEETEAVHPGVIELGNRAGPENVPALAVVDGLPVGDLDDTLPDEVDVYGAALPTVLRVKPGCTGLWQTSGRSNLTIEERVVLDVRYVSERNLRGDVLICAKTVSQMLRPHDSGAY